MSLARIPLYHANTPILACVESLPLRGRIAGPRRTVPDAHSASGSQADRDRTAATSSQHNSAICTFRGEYGSSQPAQCTSLPPGACSGSQDSQGAAPTKPESRSNWTASAEWRAGPANELWDLQSVSDFLASGNVKLLGWDSSESAASVEPPSLKRKHRHHPLAADQIDNASHSFNRVEGSNQSVLLCRLGNLPLLSLSTANHRILDTGGKHSGSGEL